MKLLLISEFFPIDLKTEVYGVHKRLNMFIDAVKDISSLDILFYVPSSIDISRKSISEYERLLSKYWNVEIKLFLCHRFMGKGTLSIVKLLRIYFNCIKVGAVSPFPQKVSFQTCGPQQVTILEDCLCRKPDAIFTHRLGAISPLLLTSQKLPPVFFDMDDIEHLKFRRKSNLSMRLYEKFINYLQTLVFYRSEYRAIRLAHKSFVCSEMDRNYINQLWNLPGVVTISNAVTIPEAQPVTESPTMLFLGTYHYRPNVIAAEYLIQEILPVVRRVIPKTRLIIAGSAPEMIRFYKISIPGVEYTGFVENLNALYEHVSVICCPIQYGGGTRIKIIEAAAYGKPIVATSFGAKGIEMQDGLELLVRDEPGAFAEACIYLLNDTDLRNRLGSAARKTAIRLYNRDNTVNLIQSCIKEDLSADNL